MAVENPATLSAGPNWFQNWVSRLARSTPMALVVPPNGLALRAVEKSVNVVARPGATPCWPSMQNVVKEAGRPASRASPEAFVQLIWPTFLVCQAIGAVASPTYVTGRETASRVGSSVAVVAISCRRSSASSDSGRRSRGCARLTRACLRRERAWGEFCGVFEAGTKNSRWLIWGGGIAARRGRTRQASAGREVTSGGGALSTTPKHRSV